MLIISSFSDFEIVFCLSNIITTNFRISPNRKNLFIFI
jgi:hypothetical protein